LARGWQISSATAPKCVRQVTSGRLECREHEAAFSGISHKDMATTGKRGKTKAAPTAAPWVPSNPSLEKLREAARSCRGCNLWERATQTVFGEGLSQARVMFVGEQPGDREDLAGRPFVGPAGWLLDKALAEFPEDVAAAAELASGSAAKMKVPTDPRAEPWPPMRVGTGL